MNAEIICIGNEILNGHISDTNSGFISKKLSELGIDVKYISVVGDNKESIISALDIARYRAEMIFITGGLGPTHDDVTMETVASYLAKELNINDKILEKLDKLANNGRKMGDSVYKMALVPENAKIFDNKVGVAPGVLLEDDGIMIFLLPGVPREVKSLMEESVVPYLKNIVPKFFIKEKVIRTQGITESMIFEKVGAIGSNDTDVSFLPQNTGVDLKIRVKGSDEKEVKERIEKISHIIEEKLQEWIYSANGEEFEELVGKLLTEKNMTLATAESCTGGLVANLITNVPGSSKYFKRGFVTYSNISKTEELGVSSDIIEKFGAVSEEVAYEMAKGTLNISKTDIAVATTGIAGPTGGSEEKPVGLVYIGVAYGNKVIVEKHIFKGDRLQNKRSFATAALASLYKVLKSIDS
jgi:nicotinamide-nucleotide amidase